MLPSIPTTSSHLIRNEDIPADPMYQGLRIVRYQNDENARDAFTSNRYQFQHQHGDYTILKATLCLKGVVNARVRESDQRLAAVVHPTLKMFADIVRYDPSNPPTENWPALQMAEAHQQTQSDFQGQKKANRDLFKNYLLEGIRGERPLFLPMISGWQSVAVFPQTIFVAFDEEDPAALYGLLYLPKSPIMQSDGQTQTSALFAIAHMKDAEELNALEDLRVTLEIEFNVPATKAGQSFADRNGRGTKKNVNLVKGLDVAAALSRLRIEAIKGTIFENRIADGRTTGATETATQNIVDLSTIEQMLMNALTGGRYQPEQFKHYHIETFLPYAKEFLAMLEEVFGAQWPELTPAKSDPFRVLYIHGWAFALKAIALCYYEARKDELGPLSAAVGVKDASRSVEDAFRQAVAREQAEWSEEPKITLDGLKNRLRKIDWLRYRKHWVELTGAKVDKDGNRRTKMFKSTGTLKVLGQAQNTATSIQAVKNMILSERWERLTHTEDADPNAKEG